MQFNLLYSRYHNNGNMNKRKRKMKIIMGISIFQNFPIQYQILLIL